MTSTPSRPSELPRVLIVATMGFSSQMAAYFLAVAGSIPFPLLPAPEVRIRSISHPATRSATANTAFPDAKSAALPSGEAVLHAVGRRSQASKGV